MLALIPVLSGILQRKLGGIGTIVSTSGDLFSCHQQALNSCTVGTSSALLLIWGVKWGRSLLSVRQPQKPRCHNRARVWLLNNGQSPDTHDRKFSKRTGR